MAKRKPPTKGSPDLVPGGPPPELETLQSAPVNTLLGVETPALSDTLAEPAADSPDSEVPPPSDTLTEPDPASPESEIRVPSGEPGTPDSSLPWYLVNWRLSGILDEDLVAGDHLQLPDEVAAPLVACGVLTKET